jgi:hypothetical protein
MKSKTCHGVPKISNQFSNRPHTMAQIKEWSLSATTGCESESVVQGVNYTSDNQSTDDNSDANADDNSVDGNLDNVEDHNPADVSNDSGTNLHDHDDVDSENEHHMTGLECLADSGTHGREHTNTKTAEVHAIYTTFSVPLSHTMQNASLVSVQMNAKVRLKRFGQAGAEAIRKELHQIITLHVMSGCMPGSLSSEQKQKALRYLMFLKEKRCRCRCIKGQGCADGHKQQVYKTSRLKPVHQQ